MPDGIEITAVCGVVVVYLVGVLSSRLLYFHDHIEKLRDQVDEAHDEGMQKLGEEVTKGAAADLEEVVNLVQALSSVDGLKDKLKALDKTMKQGFFFDIGSIGVVVLIAILSFSEGEFDLLTLSFIAIAIYTMMFLQASFIGSVRTYFRCEGKLRDRKEKAREARRTARRIQGSDTSQTQSSSAPPRA